MHWERSWSRLDDQLPREYKLRKPGCLCSYDAYLTFSALAGESQSAILDLASRNGITVDVGREFLEFTFTGRDTNEHVVEFLRKLALIIGNSEGEVRCEITNDERDPEFEFFQIAGAKLLRQRGQIVRAEPEEA